MDNTQTAINISNTAQKLGAVSAGSSPFVGLLLDNSEVISLILGIGGFFIALSGFAVAWIYNHKRYRLEVKRFESGKK